MTLRGRKSNRSFLRLIRYVSYHGFSPPRTLSMRVQRAVETSIKPAAAGYFVAPAHVHEEK